MHCSLWIQPTNKKAFESSKVLSFFLGDLPSTHLLMLDKWLNRFIPIRDIPSNDEVLRAEIIYVCGMLSKLISIDW